MTTFSLSDFICFSTSGAFKPPFSVWCKIELNSEQTHVLEMALKGHSMVILGQSGTGKSFLGKTIAKTLKNRGVATQMTATTGIAALNENG
ncbi:hypothetical protein KUTeg_016913 [Tegillarca granosa]|uniref:ATP-dependent DNA helicase n=1 Tax=Tegillarca granosa TaxID=220873 RepID=A0ABQ9EMA2_TEGGR|nr:hypothetical protein KUTeg_016913 [Tegillarca granosa]